MKIPALILRVARSTGVAIYKIERTQVLRMPPGDCWDFFSDPRNLEKITPPQMRFRSRSHLPEKIYPGMLIEYRVSPLLGLPLRWLTEITQVNEPHHFIDEQRVGPYRLWHHEHFFRALDDGRVEVRDLVHYVPPFGPLGILLNALVIRPQLARIFSFREKQLTALAQEKL